LQQAEGVGGVLRSKRTIAGGLEDTAKAITLRRVLVDYEYGSSLLGGVGSRHASIVRSKEQTVNSRQQTAKQ